MGNMECGYLYSKNTSNSKLRVTHTLKMEGIVAPFAEIEDNKCL